MFKRAFFAMVGLGAGVAIGVWGIRKLEETQRKMTPEHLAGVAAGRVGSLRDRLAVAVAEGREAAAAKEAELRASLGGRPEHTEELFAEHARASGGDRSSLHDPLY